jgi:CubicO group peptidase (beta-lactamase class C family)
LKEKQNTLGGNVCMLVYKDNKIVYEKNLGKYNSATIEPIASCSKWLTAALVMRLVEEGKLSLEDSIGKFLPVFTKNKKGNIKVKHCLSHTTGIQGEQITIASLMARKKYSSLEEEVNEIALKPKAAKPGDQFFYGSIGINIAGRIIEVITKKDFESNFQERIAKPLEMKNTSFKSNHAVDPSGGVRSTASDYMNFLIMILNKGTFKGEKILESKSIEQMQQNFTEDVKVSFVPDQAMGLDYGLGEWIVEKDEDDNTAVVSSPGLFGAFPYVDLLHNYAAIIFVKTFKFKDRDKTYKEIKAAVDKAW